MILLLEKVCARVSKDTREENMGLIIELAELPPDERKTRFFRILNLLEIKVATHCKEAEREVQQFSEIVTAFRAAEQTRH